MRKLTLIILVGLIFSNLIFCERVAAVTVEEVRILVAGYPDGYFTNANAGLKSLFLKSLDTISSNLNLLNSETDEVFKAELDQETHNDIEKLITKVNGCIPDESNNPDSDDWLADCQAQNEIYFELEEMLANY